MTWSTQRLAEIANTTVNSIRHYHKVGLLPQPDRAANGYKHYEVTHLIRLIEIKRLTELGISLPQIAAMDRSDTDSLRAMRSLDAHLEGTIDRLSRVRADLALILTHQVPAVTSPGFAAIASDFSETQRSLLAIYAKVFDDAALKAFRQALSEPTEADKEFDRLPEHADETRIVDLAHQLVPVTQTIQKNHPQLINPLRRSPLGPKTAARTLGQALAKLYNPAQLRVLQLLEHLLRSDEDGSGADGSQQSFRQSNVAKTTPQSRPQQ